MRLRYAGFREEAAYNEVPGAATFHVDIASTTLDAPGDTEIVYGGGLGRASTIRRPGYYSPAGNIVYAFDIRTVGYLLRWALFGYTFTSATSPELNCHEIYGVDDAIPPTFCARLGKDYLEHVFSGCAINSLTLSVDDGFCQGTMDIVAARDTRAALQAVTALLLPVNHPLVFHEVRLRIAGEAVTEARVKSLELTISNGIDVGRGRGLGSRHPLRLIAGEREVSMAVNLYFENAAELDRLWGGATGPTADGSTEFSITITFSAGAAGSLVITLPRAWYTAVSTQPSGKDEIVQAATIKCLTGNITLHSLAVIQSEILASLLNEEGSMI